MRGFDGELTAREGGDGYSRRGWGCEDTASCTLKNEEKQRVSVVVCCLWRLAGYRIKEEVIDESNGKGRGRSCCLSAER